MVTTDTTSKTGWRQYVQIHPAADALPLLPPDQLRELADDIERRGLRTSIRILGTGADGLLSPKGAVLIDGRNRLDAWALLGRPVIDPTTGDWAAEIRNHVSGETMLGGARVPHDEAVAEVISHNIRRRHLSERERVDLALAVVQATKKTVLSREEIIGDGSLKISPPRGRGRPRGLVAQVAKVAKVDTKTARKHLVAQGVAVPKRPARPVHAPRATSKRMGQTATSWDGRAKKAQLRSWVEPAYTAWPEDKRSLFLVFVGEIVKEIDRAPRTATSAP